MSSTPWTVQRSKRKQSNTTPASRKRARISDDVGEKKASSARRNQSTLTQIQWISSPNANLEGDSDMQDIELSRDTRMKRPNSKGRKLKKRDSTLTQMDWLGGFQVYEDDIMDDSAMLSEQTDVQTTQIPQTDGPHDSPQKMKKRKSLSDKQPGGSSSVAIGAETQGYEPTKKRKQMQDDTRTPRRKSARIASRVLSDPNTDIHNTDPARLSPTKDSISHSTPKRPLLEVKDSTGLEDELTPRPIPIQPQTPRRQREVPSSQTPETVTRTQKQTRQTAIRTPTKSVGRKPLREKSTNILPKSYSQGLAEAKSMLRGRIASPKRSKICVLKIPGKKLFNRASYVDDSQRDIYSIQGTSPASRSSRQSDRLTEGLKVTQADLTEQLLEIPPSSERRSSSDRSLPSSPPNMAADGSLPELCDLIPHREANLDLIDEKYTAAAVHKQASVEESIQVYDIGCSDSQKKNLHTANTEITGPGSEVDDDEMLLDKEADFVGLPNPQSTSDVADDKDSDFGSPIANDTQFNHVLLDRLSSPQIIEHATASPKLERRHENLETTNLAIPEANLLGYQVDAGETTDFETQPTQLVPRLIEHSTSLGSPIQAPGHAVEDEYSDLPSYIHQSDGHRSTTKIPLNDTLETSSSSPFLPPIKPVTQRSIHPASMPRPSQVSTQEPTQNYLLSSVPAATQRVDETERYTIKDSSSIRLSQIPQHETQNQGFSARPIVESDDDVDDLDLDPSSVPLGRQSARKPVALPRKEMGSSLKTLHPPSEGSSEQDKSSSPLLKASISRRAGSAIGQVKRPDKSVNKRPDMPPPPATTRADEVYDSEYTSSSPISSPNSPPLKRKYDPLPGFDNETQSNFTQNGHITAAYIHRQRETGNWPEWFVPEPFQISNFKRPAKSGTSSKKREGGVG